MSNDKRYDIIFVLLSGNFLISELKYDFLMQASNSIWSVLCFFRRILSYGCVLGFVFFPNLYTILQIRRTILNAMFCFVWCNIKILMGVCIFIKWFHFLFLCNLWWLKYQRREVHIHSLPLCNILMGLDYFSSENYSKLLSIFPLKMKQSPWYIFQYALI